MNLPCRHRPTDRTWYDGILKSYCTKCGKVIIRKHDLKWVLLDKNLKYLDTINKRMADRYGTGKGKREKTNTGGFV